MNTDDSGAGRMISLGNQLEGGAVLAFASIFIQIPHQKEPEISVGVFSRM